MKKSFKGIYKPTNPKKYVGNPNNIVYRSLLERKFMVYCDNNPGITNWASEELPIRYYNPIDKKYHRYFPDFILKTDKGKKAQYDKRDELLSFFSPANKKSLVQIFELQKVIVLAKLKLINILQRLSNIDTFVKTKKGFKVTGEEGYVAIDQLGGDAVKIVDRMEFSYNNFSPDILKGWDKPGRK